MQTISIGVALMHTAKTNLVGTIVSAKPVMLVMDINAMVRNNESLYES